MENGFYAARIMDEGVQTICVDEDTVYYAQTAKMFRSRDAAKAEQLKQEERSHQEYQRIQARKLRKLRETICGCARWATTGALVCLTHALGLWSVIVATLVCFGAVCYHLGAYARKEREY